MNPKDENTGLLSEHSGYVKNMLEVEVFPNLSQQVIMTTEDRLKLCLQENLKKAEKKHDWLTPFSLLIAIITTFVTAEFKDYFLSSKTWEAFFLIGGLASVVWFGISLRHAFKKIKIEKIIEDLKTNSKSLNK